MAGRLVTHSLLYLSVSLVSVFISLVMLPISTRVIGPVEYGEFAVALAVSGFVTAIAGSLSGYVLQENLLKHDVGARGPLVTSAIAAVAGAAALSALLLWPLVGLLLPLFDGGVAAAGSSQYLVAVICLLATALGSPWIVGSELCMLEERPWPFALSTVLQALANAGTTLFFLYICPLPALALALGYAAGQLVLLLGTASLAIRRFAWPRLGWFRAMARGAPAVGGAALVEAARSALERGYVATFSGIADVGYFAHSQLYKNWAMFGVNAVSRAMLSTNLREAQAVPAEFLSTLRSWQFVQAGVTFGCLCFALVGHEVVGLLTNGKFEPATPLALILLVSLLLQTAGKREMSLLVARGQSASYATATLLGAASGILALLALVPALGATGAAIAVLIQVAVTRLLTVLRSRRVEKLPLREHWTVIGSIATLGLWLALTAVPVPLSIRLLLVAALFMAFAATQWRNMLAVISMRPTSSAPPEVSP